MVEISKVHYIQDYVVAVLVCKMVFSLANHFNFWWLVAAMHAVHVWYYPVQNKSEHSLFIFLYNSRNLFLKWFFKLLTTDVLSDSIERVASIFDRHLCW